jgi:hypothetical protein
VPAGEGGIVRLIRTSPNSWAHSDRTSVTIQPGQTTQVTLGDSGTTIKGTVRFETPPADEVPPVIQGNLSSQLNLPPFNSSAEAHAFYSSPEWKELSKLRKNYAVAINADSSFMVEDVVPGTYTLNVSARKGGDQPWSHPPFASVSTPVIVPDSASPMTVINIGELVLKATPAQ